MNRRELIAATGGLLGAAMLGRLALAAPAKFEIAYSDAEWKKRLSKDEYRILRERATERAGTSELLHEKRSGVFVCAGCTLPVYRSADKYDSGTGWPSFTRAINGNVDTAADRIYFMPATEVHCRRCGGHLGHIFDDGPAPTGKRHCINGDALDFVAAKTKAKAI